MTRLARSWRLALALVAGCGPSVIAPETGPTGHAADPPEILHAGCDAVGAGCRLRSGAPLRLWVAAPAGTELVATLDEAPLPATWEPAADGLRTALEPGPGVLTLRTAGDDWRWSLTLRPSEPPPPALAEVDARSRAGAHAEATAALQALLPDLKGPERAEALKLRGDLEFRRGDVPAALAAYDVAFDAALAAELLGRASDIALTASYACTALVHDFAAARRWLARHEALRERVPEARLRHGYYAGLLSDWTGDMSAAIRDYREHARIARALGQAVDLAAALSLLGVLLGRIGDDDAAEAAFAEAIGLGDHVPADIRAILLYNAAWVALEARARGEDAPDPEPRLAEAAALFAADGPHPDRLRHAEARVNLAYAAVLRGDADAAARALAGFESPNRGLARWQLYLAARVDALAGRDAEALARFTELRVRARDEEDRGLEWSAEIGAGEALAALGRDDEALARFRSAAALHRADVGALALDLGRERFAAGRDGGAQRLVALLLRRGRAEEALCAARQARSHAFADLAAAARDPAALAAYRQARAALDAAFEQTWDLPLQQGEQERGRLRARRRDLDADLDATLRGVRNTVHSDMVISPGDIGHVPTSVGAAARGDTPESAPVATPDRTSPGGSDMKRQVDEAMFKSTCPDQREPGPGELLLVYYPVGRGWAGFARDASGLRAAEIAGDLPDAPEPRAARLLGPFADALAEAGQVTIAASGSLAAEAFHALPWEGAPLVASRAVAYSLDLPHVPGPPRALARAVQLVPPSNLVRAREEADAAAGLLDARGVALSRLRGEEPDLLARLAGADLLHFVGHARGDGWGGALDLGGDRTLRAADLLTAPAPALAVLSGCETGLLDPRAHAGGMSLAHALLLAGARGVIAADARVADDLAAELVPRVLAALADGADPGEALRAAQRALLHVRDDWSRFRAHVP